VLVAAARVTVMRRQERVGSRETTARGAAAEKMMRGMAGSGWSFFVYNPHAADDNDNRTLRGCAVPVLTPHWAHPNKGTANMELIPFN
jgi:hypothetical protein